MSKALAFIAIAGAAALAYGVATTPHAASFELVAYVETAPATVDSYVLDTGLTLDDCAFYAARLQRTESTLLTCEPSK